MQGEGQLHQPTWGWNQIANTLQALRKEKSGKGTTPEKSKEGGKGERNVIDVFEGKGPKRGYVCEASQCLNKGRKGMGRNAGGGREKSFWKPWGQLREMGQRGRPANERGEQQLRGGYPF